MAEIERLIKSYLPMSEASFLLLFCLQQENHGYGIMQQVQEWTEGRVAMGAGTGYTILYKMENDGLIEVTRTFERRKLYKITPVGEAILEKETERIRQLARIADQRELVGAQ